MTDQIAKAMWFAREKHVLHFDDNGKNHIVHCEQVANILKSVTDDPDLIAAAWLHDTVEDTSATHDELVATFGNRIADLVKEVTSVGSNSFPNLHSKDGITLKFADRLSNISRMNDWSSDRQAFYLSKSKFWKS